LGALSTRESALRVALLDFVLPPERIAQKPPEAREGGRLLVVDPRGVEDVGLLDSTIEELPNALPTGALLVVNDTRVLPARLHAKKAETGGKVEIFLVRREPAPAPVPATEATEDDEREEDETPAGEIWRALGKSSKPLRFDQDLEVGEDLFVRILGRADDDGLLRVRLTSPTGMEIEKAIEAYGHVPLPPYIKRTDEADDAERYQTVFARKAGAVAAPTAGLHLSRALLGRLAIAGVELTSVTLHVGLGTFQPVTADDFDRHPMHEEHVEVPRAAVDAILRAKKEGRPIVAVGTTVVRALESAAREAERRGSPDVLVPFVGATKLLLQPGERIRVVDALLTNFHLPKSTLLALVATFLGVRNLKRAYQHAIDAEYRFYSYGDAMLIRRALDPEAVRTSLALEEQALATLTAEGAAPKEDAP
jgi:S-adenosylmethionine:tRNA ribosyltransferase-isomerase